MMETDFSPRTAILQVEFEIAVPLRQFGCCNIEDVGDETEAHIHGFLYYYRILDFRNLGFINLPPTCDITRMPRFVFIFCTATAMVSL